MQSTGSTDPQLPPGVVELREDVPLKAGHALSSESGRCCSGGPRFILWCFAVLTALITLALFTQIYYGDYEVVPHGSVSSSAANCSRTGTDALKAGGRAMDAAATTAICLAVFAPHRTGLDASGSLLYWDYRTSHRVPPILAEWGGPGFANETDRPPRMIAAFASLHARLGVLPWSKILQPAINFAREGFNVSEGLAAVAAAENLFNAAPGTVLKNPALADYLEKIQHNTSLELAMSWGSDRLIRSDQTTAPIVSSILDEGPAGRWKVYAGGAGASVAVSAMGISVSPPYPNSTTAFQRVVSALQNASLHGEWPPTGVSSGLAVVDRYDTYIALTTGLSKPFGSGPASPDGWMLDEPKSQLDLAPAIIVDEHVCGTRYVIGAESSSSLAEGATSLLTSNVTDMVGAIEQSRVGVFAGGVLAIEAVKKAPAGLIPAVLVNATFPYPAVNVVRQTGDALQSHADSRGGKLAMASRFK